MERLAAMHKDKLIDLLAERMTFEREGVRLYAAIIEKIEGAADPRLEPLLETLREHANDEAEHERWLADQIRSLGGDVDERSERVRLIEVESKGLRDVVLDGDLDVSHLFHALLLAELVDNAGWELLIELADEADDDEARRALGERLHQEEAHLIFARRAVVAFARREVLGLEASASMPSSPL